VSNRFKNRLKKAANIIDGYAYREPFNLYLKGVFRKNKGFGSKDRKFYKSACYSYFRLGVALMSYNQEERLLLGLYLTGEGEKLLDFKEVFSEEFGDIKFSDSLEERIQYIKTADESFDEKDLFPYTDLLSDEIDHSSFSTSLLRKKPMWVRIAEGQETRVLNSFKKMGIEPENVEGHLKIDQNLPMDNLAKLPFEIQDIGSQKVGSHIELNEGDKVWDCCCGAGGKSLMMSDNTVKHELYVSDTRKEIMQNLFARYRKYDYDYPASSVVDLQVSHKQLQFLKRKQEEEVGKGFFDVIVADVPCTGSGTWGRNPEELSHFNEDRLLRYSERQFAIVKNAIPFLKPEGKLYYITCSAFQEENENLVNAVCGELGLISSFQTYVKGYEMEGDTFFIAELHRNLK
jgi:16S rRNA (cytosine967-C5)-methyltransferase